MNSKMISKAVERYSKDCIQCSICLNTCSLLDELGMTPGEIAMTVERDQVSEELLAVIQRCDLCGQCSYDCLVNLNPSELILNCRKILVESKRITPEEYDVMLVDRDWNFFTIFRDTYNINYDDLYSEIYDVLFFPGCTLHCYSPELTRAAFNWLRGEDINIGYSYLCCGKPLEIIGLSVEADRYLDHLRKQLTTSGAQEIITACPNCESLLKSQLPKVKVTSIYDVFVKAGLVLSGSETVTVHDSCPDRYIGENPKNVRHLLSGFSQREMESWGSNTICCGSGGIVSTIDPGLCSARAIRRMAEFSETKADVCVTSCMACSHRLARVSESGQIRHILEFVFDVQVDYKQIEKKIRDMWQGKQGEINIQRISQAQLMVVEE